MSSTLGIGTIQCTMHIWHLPCMWDVREQCCKMLLAWPIGQKASSKPKCRHAHANAGCPTFQQGQHVITSDNAPLASGVLPVIHPVTWLDYALQATHAQVCPAMLSNTHSGTGCQELVPLPNATTVGVHQSSLQNAAKCNDENACNETGLD